MSGGSLIIAATLILYMRNLFRGHHVLVPLKTLSGELFESVCLSYSCTMIGVYHIRLIFRGYFIS